MKTQKLGATFFLCIALLFPCAEMLFSQAGRGGISGLVGDTSGAIVPGATVTAKNAATGETLSTTTTGAGLYSFISLSPGKYEVSATTAGVFPPVPPKPNHTLSHTTPRHPPPHPAAS